MPKVGSLVALRERWVAHECRQLCPPGSTSQVHAWRSRAEIGAHFVPTLILVITR